MSENIGADKGTLADKIETPKEERPGESAKETFRDLHAEIDRQIKRRALLIGGFIGVVVSAVGGVIAWTSAIAVRNIASDVEAKFTSRIDDAIAGQRQSIESLTEFAKQRADAAAIAAEAAATEAGRARGTVEGLTRDAEQMTAGVRTAAANARTAVRAAGDVTKIAKKVSSEIEGTDFAKKLANTKVVKDLVSRLVPVGSVVAWAGLPPKDADWDWRVCNGAPLSTISLDSGEQKALSECLGGKLKLPDYRGYFLRGVAKRRADESALTDRQETLFSHANKRVGGSGVGSTQGWRTGAPQKWLLEADENPSRKGKAPRLGDDLVSIKAGSGTGAGPFRLSHVTNDLGDGWDSETRPANVYVHWIIKVK